MAYTIDLNKVALKFDEPCCFNIQGDSKGYFGLYRVYINNVFFKTDKNAKIQHHIPIFGMGYTIEDAANDFFRKARTGLLYHIISNKTESVV